MIYCVDTKLNSFIVYFVKLFISLAINKLITYFNETEKKIDINCY